MYNFNTTCKVWYELWQWALRKCMDYNVPILTQSQIKGKPTQQRHFSKYILNSSYNDQRTSPPTTNKSWITSLQSLQVRPYGYHHTTLRLQITGFASLQYTMWVGVRQWHNRDASGPVQCSESYTAVLIMHVVVQFNLLFYTSRSGICNKNRNEAHFTVYFLFLFFVVLFVKYIHKTRQMASIMRRIVLVQSVTKKAVPPSMS